MSTLTDILRRLNDRSGGVEISIPGNWSPTLFRDDMLNYKPVSEELFIQHLCQVIQSSENVSYLKFFHQSRNYERPNSKPELFQLFEKRGLMLYFEKYFLECLKGSSPKDAKVFALLEELSKSHYTQWKTPKPLLEFAENPRRFV